MSNTVAADTFGVASWLNSFQEALEGGSDESVRGLLDDAAEWRDILAFTGDYNTAVGAREVGELLVRAQQWTRASAFRVDERRTPPHVTQRGGLDVIEAHFRFETSAGTGAGVLRLVPGEQHPRRAAAILTTLDALRDFPEQRGPHRPHNTAYSRTFGGRNWLDERETSREFLDREPDVLVVGAGQAGLSVAARLKVLGVETLVVEALPRVGDVWRRRYHSLTLHNQAWAASLPYLEFPDSWCTYIPKDKLAGWFEFYAEAMELDVWTSTQFTGASFDEEAGTWTVELDREHERRTLRPRHIVMCTGSVSGVPSLPTLPGLDEFRGQVLHSSAYTSGASFSGQRALVVGTGTSGHDVAQDLYSLGAEVTIMQRSSTTVVSLEPSAQMVYALYSLGLPLEEADLVAAASTYPAMVRGNQALTRKMLQQDADLIRRLEAVGFRTDVGDDGTGFHLKYNRRGGGYYINVGCSDLIADRKIRLIHSEDVQTFSEGGLALADGRHLDLDLIVLATGYLNQQEEVRRTFGEDVADTVGPIWGVDEQGEMRNVWRRTAQGGLWFNAGSLAACRVNSKYLALAIKGELEGIVLGDPGRDGR